MTLDPQMKIFVDQLTAAGIPPDFAAIGAVAAQELVSSRPMPGEGPQVARVVDLQIPGRNATMPARLYVPDQPPCGLLVYLHGGGWVLGNISGYDPPLRHFANRAGERLPRGSLCSCLAPCAVMQSRTSGAHRA